MRRAVVTLLVLVALLAVLDRVALWAAEHDVAERLQADAQLRTTPDVSIHGYPFLTQLIGGDYDDVDVDMHGLDSNGLRISRLSVHVHGAHVSLGDVLGQDRSPVHVDRATARLVLTYADLDAFVRRQAGAVAPHRLDRSVVRGASVAGNDRIVLRTSYGDVPITVADLPFGIRLTSAETTQSGIDVTGGAAGLLLPG
jgi:hypothetical protein